MRLHIWIPEGLEWVTGWLDRYTSAKSMLGPTSRSNEIVNILLEFIHREDRKVEIPLVYVDAIEEMFRVRGALHQVRMENPVLDRPFLRFMWRESQIFIYKINETFAEVICQSANSSTKEEFSNILFEFIDFLNTPENNSPDAEKS